jgi:hypothetical protein
MARKTRKHVTPPLLPDLVETPHGVTARVRPLPASTQALFLPDLVEQAARNTQIDAYAERRDHAHGLFRTWIEKLEAGHLQSLNESQIEQDFTSLLLTSLGYTSHGQTLPGQPWSMEPKWSFPGCGNADVVLGAFQHDDSNKVRGKIDAVVELKGPKVDLDRHDTATGRTPIGQAWDYLTATDAGRWAIATNFVELRLYHRDKGRSSVHQVDLLALADPEEFARFFALFHADSLLSESRLTLNAAEILRRTGERQEKVGTDLYKAYDEQRFRLIQTLRHEKGIADLDRAIETAQKLLDRILFIAFAEDKHLLDDRRTIERTFQLRVPTQSAWNNFQNLFRALNQGDVRSGIPQFNGTLFAPDPILDDPGFSLSDDWPQFFQTLGQFDYRNEVSVDILGRIFERSLTDLEKLREGGEAKYQEVIDTRRSPGRRKKEGIFYTDRYIVVYLVGAALDPLWDEIKPGDDTIATAGATRARLARLDALKVCDPACGSGAFLIAVYDWFEDRRLRLLDDLDAAEPGAPECRGGHEDWRAACARQILGHNLYGVDLALEAVEIARLSLWIHTARKGQTLTNLSHNIG